MDKKTQPMSLPPLPPAPSNGPDIVYEDMSIIVIDKPAWLLSVPGKAIDNQDCATSRLAKTRPQVLVVHRLDCATQGLMMFAKTKAAQSYLNSEFQKRTIHKTYHAEVIGLIADDKGTIDQPLTSDWPNRPKQKIDLIHGKPSITHWSCLERRDETSLLKLTPITGRSHQLRVHLQSIGHPILGDRLYAPTESLLPYPTLKLKATRLSFTHPDSLKIVTFSLTSNF